MPHVGLESSVGHMTQQATRQPDRWGAAQPEATAKAK
jgi:hypothetical protein